MASKIRLATNLWLYPQFSRVCSRVGPRPYKYGREQWGVISLKPAWDLWSHVDPMSLLCRSYVTHKLLAIHSWSSYVPPMSLGKNCHSGEISRVTCDWPTSVPSHIWVLEWHTTNLWGLATDIRASPDLATREKFPDRFEPFHTVGELVPSDGEAPRVVASVHE